MSATEVSSLFRLDLKSGVPVYRQLIDLVLLAISTGRLQAGDQLPTVRQLAVELAINPNTVVRAYKELEIRGVLATQQGIGTFVTTRKVKQDEAQRQRRLAQFAADVAANAGREGFSLSAVIAGLQELAGEQEKRS